MTITPTKFAIAFCAVLSLGASTAQAADIFCVTIVSSKQGTLASTGQRASACGAKIEGLSFGYGVANPRDQNTGQETGRRQHKPVRIKKQWSAASPQLFQALISGEPLTTVTFDFFAIDQITGRMVVDHSINLTNAFVTSIEHSSEARLPTGLASNENPTEVVEFTFQRIELIDARGKTSAID